MNSIYFPTLKLSFFACRYPVFIQSFVSTAGFICKALSVLLTINISEYKNSDKSSCGKVGIRMGGKYCAINRKNRA